MSENTALASSVVSYNMVDMGFMGPRFTWRCGRIYEKLDKATCNVKAKMKYENAVMYQLSRVWSNHWPILVSLGDTVMRMQPNPKPF